MRNNRDSNNFFNRRELIFILARARAREIDTYAISWLPYNLSEFQGYMALAFNMRSIEISTVLCKQSNTFHRKMNLAQEKNIYIEVLIYISDISTICQ